MTISNAIGDQQAGHKVTPNILKGTDGVLRWVYEMSMWRNPTLIITIWKVILIGALAPALLVFFLSLGDGDGFLAALWTATKILGLVALIVTALLWLVAYPLVALLNGGSYCVVFEMADTGVKHIQMQKQFEKSQVLQMVTVLAGLAAGNAQVMGAGLLAGSKQSTVSEFAQVKSVIVHQKRHVIYVNENLSYNQVYADPADFDFVCDYILSRCKKAKVSYKSSVSDEVFERYANLLRLCSHIR